MLGIHLSEITPYVVNKVAGDSWESLTALVTLENVRMVLFSMGDDKALGPNGFTVKFFKKAWDVVGSDMAKAIRIFFSTRRLLGEVNATVISLVPKVPHLESLTQFRLISCCNVVYKIISKILANRLKIVLPDLVNES